MFEGIVDDDQEARIASALECFVSRSSNICPESGCATRALLPAKITFELPSAKVQQTEMLPHTSKLNLKKPSDSETTSEAWKRTKPYSSFNYNLRNTTKHLEEASDPEKHGSLILDDEFDIETKTEPTSFSNERFQKKTQLTQSDLDEETEHPPATGNSSAFITSTTSKISSRGATTPATSFRTFSVSSQLAPKTKLNINSKLLSSKLPDFERQDTETSNWEKKGLSVEGIKEGETINLQNPQRTLSHEMKSMVNNKDFCDVIFKVEDTPLYAHRAILGARCQKLQQMFVSLTKDQNRPTPEIPIEGVRFDVFLAMMEFLYSDNIEHVSLEMCLELLGLSKQFDLELLRALCERILEQSVTVDNVGWIFTGSDAFKATRLRELCVNFIVKNFDTVSKTKAFEDLSRELILEIIRKR